MSGSEGDRPIERSRRRLALLREQIEREGHAPESPLRQAVEELGQALGELSVTLEELTSTNEGLGAQLAAEQHARRYQDLFHFAPVGYLVTDERGVIRELNRVAEQQLGRPGRSLAGKPLLPLVAAEDRDAFLECLSALRQGRVRVQDRLLRFGSAPGFDASVSAVPERRDGRLEIRWMLREGTGLQERDAFRDEIERHLESVVWLAQLDPFRLLHASQAYETVWGRPLSSLHENPQDWLEPILPEDRPRLEAAIAALQRGEHADIEYRILRPDGEVRWIRDRGTPVPDARGRLSRAAGIAEDATEKRRARAALERAERHRRAAALAAERAEARERRALAGDLHDAVSQSLALARTKLAALRDDTEEPGRLARLREVESLIAEADERTRTLTFRLSPPILHDLGLGAAAEWLAEDMERRFGLKVQLMDVGLPEPLDFEIREALFRSLRELLVNVARHARSGEARVLLGREEDSAVVRVEDGGVGFDLRRKGAAGFGLVSVRERLEALGGGLEIDSELGHGTRARLFVPAPREP